MTRIPPPKQFFLEAAPYEPFAIAMNGFLDIMRIQFFRGTLDVYCVACGKDSVFDCTAPPLRAPSGRATPPVPVSVDDLVANNFIGYLPHEAGFPGEACSHRQLAAMEPFIIAERIFPVSFACTRNPAHKMYFFVRVGKDVIAKAGQWPSIADLKTPAIRKYRKVLGEEGFKELSRAVGLHAHGVGIGAFVYLRRIFEDLIEEGHAKAKAALDWDEDAFQRGRMDEKILLLKGELPAFVVQSRGVYSILSAGIHELDEKTCLSLFPAVETAIELMLDEKLAQKERERKTAEASKAIAGIRTDLISGK
jgi:hypothetical protein